MSMCMKKCYAKTYFWQSDCLSNLAILYGLCILDSSFLYWPLLCGGYLISIAYFSFHSYCKHDKPKAVFNNEHTAHCSKISSVLFQYMYFIMLTESSLGPQVIVLVLSCCSSYHLFWSFSVCPLVRKKECGKTLTYPMKRKCKCALHCYITG